MKLILDHASTQITIEGETFDVSHLKPFGWTINNGDNNSIRIKVDFSCHTISEASIGTVGDFQDHSGELRRFNFERYQATVDLFPKLKSQLEGNPLTVESRDSKSNNNLLIFTDAQNATYGIYYDLRPAKSPYIDVIMTVVSAYFVSDDLSNYDRRFNVHQKVKTCYYKQIRIPE